MEIEECYNSVTSNWDYVTLIIIRPILAISLVSSLIIIGWYLAWKLVLVHVPLVQEIFGLRKKPVKPKPVTRRRLSNYYNSFDASQNQSIHWMVLEDLYQNY